MMMMRGALLVALFLMTSAFLSQASRAEPVPIRQPLAELPLVIGGWHGRVEPPLSRAVLDVLRLDDYTNRSYFRSDRALGFYVGYHASQRQGASIHSPLNCLPGAGWAPTQQGRTSFEVETSSTRQTIEVNRVIIEKGTDRQLVLYWYQSHGRVVASEYWGKVYGVVDAIRLNRSDAALVRIVAPIVGDGQQATERADSDSVDFARTVFPLLARHLPS